MRLPVLTSLEVDISHFNPPPDLTAQRALACQLRTYLPPLLFVWFRTGRNAAGAKSEHGLTVQWIWNGSQWKCKEGIMSWGRKGTPPWLAVS